MNEDTLHLLSECAAGTDMAIRSLEDVLKNSAEGPLQKRLLDSKRQHEQLAAQAEDRLRHQGKEPKRADPGGARYVVSEDAGDAFHEARRRDDCRPHLDRLLHGHQVACPLLQPVSHSG